MVLLKCILLAWPVHANHADLWCVPGICICPGDLYLILTQMPSGIHLRNIDLAPDPHYMMPQLHRHGNLCQVYVSSSVFRFSSLPGGLPMWSPCWSIWKFAIATHFLLSLFFDSIWSPTTEIRKERPKKCFQILVFSCILLHCFFYL